MPNGLASPSMSAILTVGNITAWKGTTIENTNIMYRAFVHQVLMRVM